MAKQCDFGLMGLAVMGQNLVLNIADHGFSVAVFNRTTSKIDDFLASDAVKEVSGKSLAVTASRSWSPASPDLVKSCS